MLYGSFAGAAAAATDATVGWRISRAMGMDREEVPEGVEIGTATVVTLIGALTGAVVSIVTGSRHLILTD